jgi:hypothetical protein
MGYLDADSFDIAELINRLKDIYCHIPHLNPYFGYAWIIFWFLSIWIFHIQLFLTGLFCLILSFIEFDNIKKDNSGILPIIFSMNKKECTLTVDELFKENMNWEESEICSGKAILPKGPVQVGDVITNCSGNISLRHAPSNIIFGAFDFD